MAKVKPQEFINHLQGKWLGKGCPMCGISAWNIPDTVFELREFHAGNVVLGGPVVPVIPVACSNCGYTVLVNGIIAGQVDRESGGAKP